MINYKESISHFFRQIYLPVGENVFCRIPGQEETRTFCQVHHLTKTGYMVRYLVPPKDKTVYKAEEARIHYTEITFNDIYSW